MSGAYVTWKIGAVLAESGMAVVAVEARGEDGKLYGEGDVRVTEAGRLKTTLPNGDGPAELPDTLRGAVGWALGGLKNLTEQAARAAREAGAIPAANPLRAILASPRILQVKESGAESAEGCIVVVDDPAAIVASGKEYRGPPGLPNLDFIYSPAGLPGRRYLSVTNAAGAPMTPPRTLNDQVAVFDGEDTRLVLTTDFSTIYRSWEDARDAIREARERGVIK